MKEIYESKFIKCKPVAANSMYKNTGRGGRRKSENYQLMEKLCLLQMEKINLKNDKCYRMEYEFFLQRQDSDVDNYIKCFQDILQKKIREKNKDFDDKLIYEIEAKKYFPEGKNYGVKFKIFEIKIEKEKYGMPLKINKKLGVECYESN